MDRKPATRVADDAQVGYPPVRLMSPPDMQFHPWIMGLRAANKPQRPPGCPGTAGLIDTGCPPLGQSP